MKPHDVIRALEATTKKNEKEDIIAAAWRAGHRDLFRGAQLAYDALITFGVKKVPLIVEEDDEPGSATFVDFIRLADKLAKRQLTGHAARDGIEDFLNTCGVDEWNDFYRRVLLKDLKVGATETTFNKVLKQIGKTDPEALDFIIPVFACQLAPSKSYNRETIKDLRGKVLVDVKYDGMRLLSVLDKEKGVVTQHSRNGLVTDKFPHIAEALASLMGDLPRSVVIDGEVVGSSFNALMRQATKKDADTSETSLMIFDIIPLDDFRKGECAFSQEDRHAILADMSGQIQEHSQGRLFVLEKAEIDLDTEEGRDAIFEMFEEVMRMREHDKKFEGLIVKRKDAPYRCKRWNAWEKVKPYVDATLPVVGLEEGKENTKNHGSLGALVCRGKDGDRMIEVKVGSGFTEEERRLWWNNPDLVMGMMAEIEAHEFSQDMENEGTDMWSMRHPRLKGWRGSKKGEKL